MNISKPQQKNKQLKIEIIQKKKKTVKFEFDIKNTETNR